MSTLERRIGFLGCGSMSECILAGIIGSGSVATTSVLVCNRTPARMEYLRGKYGVTPASATELTENSDIIVLGVKPYDAVAVLKKISALATNDKIIVSVCAGVTIDTLQKCLPDGAKIVRVMPNVPSFVGCGMTSVSSCSTVDAADEQYVVKLFESVGNVVVVPESQIHGVISVAGSSPAYVFMFLEALSDGAVLSGISRPQAYEMASQAVLGAAKMMQVTGKTPAELKDMVCSPGGTTIEAVRYLEKGGLRSAVIEAMTRCSEKSKEMDKRYAL